MFYIHSYVLIDHVAIFDKIILSLSCLLFKVQIQFHLWDPHVCLLQILIIHKSITYFSQMMVFRHFNTLMSPTASRTQQISTFFTFELSDGVVNTVIASEFVHLFTCRTLSKRIWLMLLFTWILYSGHRYISTKNDLWFLRHYMCCCKQGIWGVLL